MTRAYWRGYSRNGRENMASKITKMSKSLSASLREELNAELVALGERHGLKLKAGTARYDDHTITYKLEVSIAGVDLDRIEFNECCYLFNLTPDDWGKELNWGGNIFYLKGLKPNRPKYPVLASDGASLFKLPRKALNQIIDANLEKEADRLQGLAPTG
jgi:hypothetical protein